MSVIDWPVGALVSSAIVIVSEEEFAALSVAETIRTPGSAAPELHE